jgi:hypothetical protein
VPTGNLGGAYAAGSITFTGSPISGNPPTQTVGSKSAAMYRLGVNWTFLTGPDVPVQYSSPTVWPNFAGMHADTFPVIRIVGDFSPTSVHNGRGILIVTGVIRPSGNFSWNGVIVAGDLALSNPTRTDWRVRGLVVSGMGPSAGAVNIPDGADLRYNRCHVMRAFAKLSHLEPISGTAWTDR